MDSMTGSGSGLRYIHNIKSFCQFHLLYCYFSVGILSHSGTFIILKHSRTLQSMKVKPFCTQI